MGSDGTGCQLTIVNVLENGLEAIPDILVNISNSVHVLRNDIDRSWHIRDRQCEYENIFNSSPVVAISR